MAKAKKTGAKGKSGLPARTRRGATDAEVAAAVVAAGGRVGKAAALLGKASKTVRNRTARSAPDPALRGLPQKVRQEVRRLVRESVLAKLREGDTRVLVELMHSRLCRDMGFAPEAQKVELSGRVDGEVRLGPIDERLVAERLRALGAGDDGGGEGA